MKIPIPFVWNQRTFTDLEVKPPRTDVIAETKDKGKVNLYEGLAVFAVGAIESITDDSGDKIDDKAQFKGIVNAMPYRDVEWIMIQAFLKTGIDDVVEGIYPCPRCKMDYIPSDADPAFDEDDPEHNDDDADRIRKLKTVLSDRVRDFTIELSPPVQQIEADTKEVIEECSSVKLRDPIMDDMIRACRKVGTNNADTFNAAIFAEATIAVNGAPVDRKWKGEWGTWLYDRLAYSDTQKLKDEIRRFGVKTTVERKCPSCSKKWEAEVDTGSFFASGLGG